MILHTKYTELIYSFRDKSMSDFLSEDVWQDTAVLEVCDLDLGSQVDDSLE